SGDGGQFYVADCSNWDASATWQSKSDIIYVAFTEAMASNGVMINGEAATINNVKLVHGTQLIKIATIGANLGSVGWGGDIKIENLSEYAAYAGKSYLKVDFTVSGDGGQFYVADCSNWDASATWQSKSGSIAVDFTSAMATNGVMINGEAATITNVDLYSIPVVEAVYAVKVTPATASVKVGETTTLTGVVQKTENGTTSDTDENVVWVSNNPAIATVSDSGIVTGVTAGTVEIRAYREGEDTTVAPPIGSYALVTVTEEGGDTPPAPPAATETLWEGSMAIGWNGNPDEGPVNMLQLGSDKFANIAAGGSLKFTFAGTGDAPQLKFMDGDWQELVSVQSDPNYTEFGTILLSGTSFSFTISAADAATLKDKGFKAGGQDCTVTKVEYIPAQGGNTPTPPPVGDPTPDDPTPDDPAHTHTPATVWSSDATGHWHTCTGCTDKVDFAAHTSDNGTVTTAATATTAGTRTYKCTVCGYVIKTETIPATGTSNTPDPWVHYSSATAPVIPTSGVNNSTAPTINGKDGWEAVAAEITAASDGDKLVVDMNGATKVPSTVFKAIKDKDVDLVLNMSNGIKWTINGLSVTSTKAIDFDVTKNTKHIPNEVADKAEGSHKKQISLDHNGNFGCSAVMTYDVGTQYNGLYANLFYYNRKAKELELIYCSPISGGKANFLFTHASDYLITISDEPLGDYEDVSSAAGITSDNSGANSIAFCSVLTVITLAFGFVVYKKRRHN
ncbi:MAG: Ig-like domain-containing protein, partial [Oscillospiraceae bacterium]|nr:Ig-like domain-containing protein [Oscillospiraceae bacterium]